MDRLGIKWKDLELDAVPAKVAEIDSIEPSLGVPTAIVVVRRDIAAGEELLV